VDENGRLVSLAERNKIQSQQGRAVSLDAEGKERPMPSETVVSMNMWAFPHAFMRELEEQFERFLANLPAVSSDGEFFLPAVVGKLVAGKRARVRVLPTGADWMGMTYREDVAQVRSKISVLIDRGIYPAKLWDSRS
jgi:hypothetical protein